MAARTRMEMLRWPILELVQQVKFVNLVLEAKVVNLLTNAGVQSLHYFAIRTRIAHPKVLHLTAREFQGIARFIIYPELRPIIQELLTNPVT